MTGILSGALKQQTELQRIMHHGESHVDESNLHSSHTRPNGPQRNLPVKDRHDTGGPLLTWAIPTNIASGGRIPGRACGALEQVKG